MTSNDVPAGDNRFTRTARGAEVGRRGFLRLGGGAVALGSMAWAGRLLLPETAIAAEAPPDLFLGGTDGWIHLPPDPPIAPFHPDVLAPEGTGLTTYIFGFRNLTGMTSTQALAQKNKAQHSAPLFWVKQYDGSNEFRVQLTNLGLALRPDLFDAHTLHWHGFRNVIPFFDGEPTGSVAVPAGRNFTYVYRPRDPGTYMWHCHVEDVEHVHMGMTGLVFVRPTKGDDYLYNDPDGTPADRSTRFDREFAMFLSEVWAEAHWADAHIQLPEWSDYRADFALLNGRVYPDTIEPNGSIDAFHPVFDSTGDLIAPAGRPDLQYQPHSSLVTCNEGDRVALRFANLGFREAAMTLSGLTMRVLGRDATPMRGRDGTDTSYETNTIDIGPGESYDVIFTAPAHTGTDDYNTYLLYNRNYLRSNNLADGGFGGQATEIRVYPAGTVATQSYPNDWGI
jgi:FtsP/CotA-like multicopper oxidase with cupredoxin domain